MSRITNKVILITGGSRSVGGTRLGDSDRLTRRCRGPAGQEGVSRVRAHRAPAGR